MGGVKENIKSMSRYQTHITRQMLVSIIKGRGQNVRKRQGWFGIILRNV